MGSGRLGLGIAGPRAAAPTAARRTAMGALPEDENTPAGVPTGDDARTRACRIAVRDHLNDDGFEAASPGVPALRTLVAAAGRNVFISQQDVLGPGYCMPAYDVRLFRALVGRMQAGVPVTIVISGPGSKGAGTGQEYTNGAAPQAVSKALANVAASRLGDRAAANRLVCRNLRLATIRTGAGETWPNGSPYGNHAKVVAVDDAQGACNLG